MRVVSVVWLALDANLPSEAVSDVSEAFWIPVRKTLGRPRNWRSTTPR
jgi:hypothetical protein